MSEKLHARKTNNARGTRENTAFPLSANFPSAGCLTAHPQGRSASEGRAALAERCAGGLPTENRAREGRAAVATLFVAGPVAQDDRGRAGPVAKFDSGLALTSPQPVLHELLINGVGAVIGKLDKDVPGGCLQRVAIVAE